MKAWQVQQLGDPEEALELAEVEEPTPGQGEVIGRQLRAAEPT